MRVLLFFLFFSVISAQTKSWGREVSFTSAATTFAIHGRGDTTIVGGIPASEQLRVYNQNELSQSTSQVTLRQTISSPSTLVDNFGRALALEGDDITGNLLIVGANGPASNKQYNGAVYFYTGDNSQWSVQQTLMVKSMMNEAWSMFGVALDLDSATDRRLVIGCSNCTSPSTFLNTGSIYVFEPSSFPRVTSWTEQQRLTTNTLYAIGSVDVQIHRDTLLGVGYTYRPPRTLGNWMKGIIFHRDLRSGEWSEVQTLMPPQETISDIDVYDDTMIIGSSNFRHFGIANAGAVFVYYPNTLPYATATSFLPSSQREQLLDGPKTTIQWTQQQALHSNNAMVNGYYGSTIKLWGNVMAITEPGSGKVYVLEREHRAGTWSQQIAISAAVSTSLTVEVQGSDVVVGDGTNAYVYSNNRLFNCLFILLQDQFGDGWGAAKLVVESPEGLESFAPGCDRENPLGIRFCATDTLDNGHYHFRIVNHEEAEFHWEILWKVYEERTGEWHIGNWKTEMSFDWSYAEEGFHHTVITHPLPSNITCSRCPTKPTTRRHLYLQRSLKGGGGGGIRTPAPTISPAPTLSISSSVNWRTLTLQDTADQAWFRKDHSGTSYYISDSKGKHLIAVGTLCATSTLLPHECWLGGQLNDDQDSGPDGPGRDRDEDQGLPPGEYILRIGGAADIHKATHLWRFCSMTADLAPQSHLEFSITDDRSRCRITSFYSRRQYCDHVQDYDVILKMHFYFDHITRSAQHISPATNTQPEPWLTASDEEILKGTLSTLLSPYTLSSVTVGAVSESELILKLALHWGTDLFQSEEVFHEQVEQLSEAVNSHLGGSMEKMGALLRGMSPQDSLFHDIQHIYLTLVEYEGITGGVKEREEVVTFRDIKAQRNSSSDATGEAGGEKGQGGEEGLLSKWSAVASWGGWGLLSVAVVLVVVVARRGRELLTRSGSNSSGKSSRGDDSSVVGEVLSCVSGGGDVEQSYSPLDSSVSAEDSVEAPLSLKAKKKKTKAGKRREGERAKVKDPLEDSEDEEEQREGRGGQGQGPVRVTEGGVRGREREKEREVERVRTSSSKKSTGKGSSRVRREREDR